MTRDMDLIRELMQRLEGFPGGGSIFHIKADDDEVQVAGFDYDQIDYHLSLIERSGLIEPCGSRPMVGITFKQLSWAGHDFVDSTRDPRSVGEDEAGRTGGRRVHDGLTQGSG